MELRPQQREALSAIKLFLEDEKQSIFILKGYAGTGKTTMIQAILPNVRSMGKFPYLMAPTGRAAKILSEKSNHGASTIHRTIYESKAIGLKVHDKDGKPIIQHGKHTDTDRANGVDDYQIWFKIKELDTSPDTSVFIIDEASMIGSHKVMDEILHYGTDVLLDDLLTFAKPLKGGKLIFVGDPAQLPPVGDNISAALNEEYFKDKGLQVGSYELTEVLRQEGKSTILKNAMKVRDLMNVGQRNELRFERLEGEVEDINEEDVVVNFVEGQKKPTIGDRIVICYTNSKAHDYNKFIREKYFPYKRTPQVGDIVQIVRNNYKYNLLNGDFAQIVEVGDNVETTKTRIWIDNKGERERVPLELQFRDVTLLSDGGNYVRCKIVETLLNNPHPTLTHNEITALYVNFIISHPDLKNDTQQRSEAMVNDVYLNALQVKYGYATTCHKAQGGEWESVYVDYQKRTGLNMDSLRWNYTATTRAINHLYGVAMPDITPFDKLRFEDIKQVAHPSKEALSLADVREVDMLPPNASNAQKAKYKSIECELEKLGMTIFHVAPLQYKDRYTIETPAGLLEFDCTYNGSGMYTHFKPLSENEQNETILPALASECEYRYNVNYSPSTIPLRTLFHRMRSVCDDLNIVITNIVERDAQYQVVYHLKTSGRFSSITFFYNRNGFVTHGTPSSDLGEEDEKLKSLINKLQ